VFDVEVVKDTQLVVNVDHSVLTGTITMPPAQDLNQQGWTEAHLFAALVLWDDTAGEFMDLEDAGIVGPGTDHLSYGYRYVSLPAVTVDYVVDITGLEDILDAAGENPCYLAAFLAEDDDWDFVSGDWYGFYGYPNQALPVTGPGAATPTVLVSDAGLTGRDFALTEQLP
jgi:hypothetical protein